MKKINLKNILMGIVALSEGMAGGVASVYCLDHLTENAGKDKIIPYMLLYLGALAVFYVVQVIVHEAGHLVFGLMTGYEFVSFRIFSHSFSRQDGKLTHKRFNIVGTLGQCLMTWPEDKDIDKAPYFWYHFGGGAFNLISAVIMSSVFLILEGRARYLLLFGAVVSLFLAVTNLIPSRIGGVANDGMNIITLTKKPEDRRLLLQNLIVNAKQYRGERLRDMEEKYFQGGDPEGDTFQNAVALMCASRELDRHEFEKAGELFSQMLNNEDLLDVYKMESKCELMFTKLMTEADKCQVDEIYDKKLRKYVEITGNTYISRKRLLFAYDLIILKDKTEADKEFNLAVNMKDSYPAQGEYDSEMELMELVKERYYYNSIENEEN